MCAFLSFVPSGSISRSSCARVPGTLTPLSRREYHTAQLPAQVAQALNKVFRCWLTIGTLFLKFNYMQLISDFKQMYGEYELCRVLVRKLIKLSTYLWIRVLLSLFIFLWRSEPISPRFEVLGGKSAKLAPNTTGPWRIVLT